MRRLPGCGSASPAARRHRGRRLAADAMRSVARWMLAAAILYVVAFAVFLPYAVLAIVAHAVSP